MKPTKRKLYRTYRTLVEKELIFFKNGGNALSVRGKKFNKAINTVFLLIIKCSIVLFMCSSLVQAQTRDFNAIVDAIYLAEGGAKATYLYGIRSIKYQDANEARQICFNSVKNNYIRWTQAGKPEDFIVFMSRRYCPVGAANDPKNLNRNWARNVKHFLTK